MVEKLTYLVGGAVRDAMMGLLPKDNDFVITGKTIEEMDATPGLRKVGQDFPVWINKSGTQFSLARKSRNNNITDFDPNTTIEEDLSKRDLTINAMATEHTEADAPERREAPKLIDPFGGRDDIVNKKLRMVSEESFSEDPVRVLRVARFCARYPDFTIDVDTHIVMSKMVREGMLDNLVPERVWQELAKGLMEKQPHRMLMVLRGCGALGAILPEVDALYGVPQPAQHHPEIDTGLHIEQCLEVAARMDAPLEVRWAVLLHDVGKGLTKYEDLPSHPGHEGAGAPLVEAICDRLKVSNTMKRIAVIVAKEHLNFHKVWDLKTTTLVKLLRRCDAFRKPDQFWMMVQACECDSRGRWGPSMSYADRYYEAATRFSNAMITVKNLRLQPIAEKHADRPEFIPVAIHAARARAIRHTERAFQFNRKD